LHRRPKEAAATALETERTAATAWSQAHRAAAAAEAASGQPS